MDAMNWANKIKVEEGKGSVSKNYLSENNLTNRKI
jgi:hypothetical protein